MEKNRRNIINKKLLYLIIGFVMLPTAIKLLIRRVFDIEFESVVWYELFDVLIVLCVAVPFLIFLYKRIKKAESTLTYQLIENQEVTNKLEEKSLELSNLAYYDQLTGLPNRYKLKEVLNNLIKDHVGKTYDTAVLFLYIDQFKIMNNVIGHELDEKFIKYISEKLQKIVPENSFVSRYSGNELVIILDNIDKTEYPLITSNITKLFLNPFLFNNEEIYTSANLGVSVYPQDGQDAETLIKNADIAMYLTKSNSGSTYQFYSAELDKDAERTIKLFKGLSHAVKEKQLRLHYQPQIDLNTGVVDGLEALVRWEHPEFGYVQPDDFISIAEETGDIIAIGNWVLLEACRQAVYWRKKLGRTLNIAVNVSVRQLEEPEFLDYIEEVLGQTGLDPQYLEIEITESMVRNLEESASVFNRLKQIGVKIVIDDFGTGYSSLSVLGFLPIDYLKIDRSFTKDMLVQDKMDLMVKTIIDMGENLDLKIIAEGIEEVEQLEVLRGYGCNIGQGYYFNRPVTASEIERKWLMKKA